MPVEETGISSPLTADIETNLIGLLHHTPRLVQILLQDAKTAVSFSGTCKTAHAIIHDHVTGIKVTGHSGYGLQYQVEAMQTLCSSSWPLLQKLDIKYKAKLQYDAIHVLSQAKWPLLAELNLSRNTLEAAAVEHLIQGGWPNLKVLKEKKRKVYAGRRGLWEALDRPMASRPLEGVKFQRGGGGGSNCAV